MTTLAERMRERLQYLRKPPVILVVEKEKEIRELILEMLSGRGFEVRTAENAAGALDLGRHEQLPIDLLLTETEPEGIKAAEMVRLLHKTNPGMKILFMSGKFDEGFAFMLGEQTGRLFLLRPFTRRELLEKIEGILG